MNRLKFEHGVDSLKGSINKFRASLENFKASASSVYDSMKDVENSVILIRTETGPEIYEVTGLMNLAGEMVYDAESNIRDIETVKSILMEDSELVLDILDELESLQYALE